MKKKISILKIKTWGFSRNKLAFCGNHQDQMQIWVWASFIHKRPVDARHLYVIFIANGPCIYLHAVALITFGYNPLGTRLKLCISVFVFHEPDIFEELRKWILDTMWIIALWARESLRHKSILFNLLSSVLEKSLREVTKRERDW